jgi:predicted transcriptional regulator
MTLVLKPETEAKLNEFALTHGCDPNALGEELLAEALYIRAAEFEDTIAGIERGWREGEEGRERTIEEYMEDVKRRKQGSSAA